MSLAVRETSTLGIFGTSAARRIEADDRSTLAVDQRDSTSRLSAVEVLDVHSHVPRPQQRAIADYLDTETARIDALIAKKRR